MTDLYKKKLINNLTKVIIKQSKKEKKIIKLYYYGILCIYIFTYLYVARVLCLKTTHR